MEDLSPASYIKGAIHVDYKSHPVDIPPDFLTTPPSAPQTYKPVPFEDEGLPEHKRKVAFTIDNVLSPEECVQLLQLAEASVIRENDSDSPWRPALVAIGDGWEAPAPGYRVGDRIIWDSTVLADLIFNRCLLCDKAREVLSKPFPYNDGSWQLHGLNERLRFLKYTENQYFRAHCDSATWLERDKTELRTFYTLHLYLNDSVVFSPTGEGLVGGATRFSSLNGDRGIDINPKAGSVLIFQHSELRHEGADVISGTKYTVRSDVFFEWLSDPSSPPETAEMKD